tara:strand:- start:98 stop:685 length:588 start_codon:yes stop_codon:yes gene_type:complete
MTSHNVCFGSLPVLCLLLSLIIPTVVFGAEEPPRGQILVEIEFKKIKDNQWCDLELKKEQPIGIYYIEMTSENKLPWGAWGSKQDIYTDGVAWKDDQPIKKADLRLQYRVKNSWVELIKVKPLGVINDAWFPFQLTKSLGQSFLAKEPFDGVGLHTPTWNQNNSTGKLTLYAEKVAKSVNGQRQLAMTWSALKGL